MGLSPGSLVMIAWRLILKMILQCLVIPTLNIRFALSFKQMVRVGSIPFILLIPILIVLRLLPSMAVVAISMRQVLGRMNCWTHLNVHSYGL